MTSATSPSLSGPAAGLRRQRLVVSCYFALAGFVLALWGADLPSVQHRLHLGVGALSVGLLCTALGMTVGLQAAGRFGDRTGAHRLMRPAALALTATLLALGLVREFTAFLVGCGLLGLSHGALDVSMNITATRCQRAYRRPIMQSIHGVYSLGALAGALAAAATARLGPQATFAGGAAAVTAALFLLPSSTTVGEQRQPEPAPDNRPVRAARPPRVILILSAVAASSLLGEGAAADWGAVQLHLTLHAGTALSAAAYACYSAAMAMSRFTGDRLARALGPVAQVRAGGLLAAAGLGTGLLVPSPVFALAGWALFGAGLAAVVPCAVTAAASVRPERSGQDVALVSTAGYLGMVVGPAAIGAIASTTNLTTALLLPAALALAVSAAAGSVRPQHVEIP
ncbi:MFS transporter [Streptacidiphilus sp. MAP5-52]|uniref:MFS transporter n=1 Tax=Streptacidiphilus sp. MAP5-52 TaxID=3156267 RepID=UPI0035110AA3